MDRNRRCLPALEALEEKLVLSLTAAPGVGPTVATQLATRFPGLHGTIAGTDVIPGSRPIPDTGTLYDLAGVGVLNLLGPAVLSGSVRLGAFIAPPLSPTRATCT